MSEPIDLDALEALCNAATPSPWRTGTGDHWSREVRAGSDAPAFCGARNGVADAALIAAMRNALPALIAELRATRAALAASEREADRLRHGVEIEGDAVCPNEWAAGELREALARYGRHEDDCRWRAWPREACSCGLQQALDGVQAPDAHPPGWIIWERATDGGRPHIRAIDLSEEKANVHVKYLKADAQAAREPEPDLVVEKTRLDHLYAANLMAALRKRDSLDGAKGGAPVETPEWICPRDASHRGELESMPPKCSMCLSVLVRDSARKAAK